MYQCGPTINLLLQSEEHQLIGLCLNSFDHTLTTDHVVV